jgi:predicted Zn-dependent peptidase
MPKHLRILVWGSLLQGMIRCFSWRTALLMICSGALLFQAEPALCLEVVADRDPARSSVLVRWELHAGSALDPESRKGLANFTARALWWGTQSRPLADLKRTLTELGASQSVTTERTRVTFQVEVPGEFFESFLHVLRDVLTQPRFDPGEMDSLRRLLRKEIREDGGQNSALGTDEGVRRIRPTELRTYFREHYHTRNMRVLITSPWEEESVRDSIERNFDSLPEGPIPFSVR